MDNLRDDIEGLEQQAQAHEARITTSEQKVADLQQQIQDLPPPPQVRLPACALRDWPDGQLCWVVHKHRMYHHHGRAVLHYI